MKKYSIFLFFTIFIFACKNMGKDQSNNSSDLNNIAKIDTISYELKNISKELGNCSDTLARCAKITMNYVALNLATNNGLNEINKQIEQSLRGDASTVNASVDSFLAEAQTFFDEAPDSPAGYAFELDQSVIFNNLQLITIEESSYSFTGGAHGNYGTGFYNFRVADGQLLELSDILKEDYESALKDIAEPIFRKTYLEEGIITYTDAGFYFDDDKFILTDNFAVTKNGIKFIYNPYEIAPYVMGQQEIFIPFDNLGDLIKKGGILENIINQQ